MIEALDDFVQKTGDNETLSHRDGNPACAKVEKLLFTDLTGCCAVRATDVISENFETGH